MIAVAAIGGFFLGGAVGAFAMALCKVAAQPTPPITGPVGAEDARPDSVPPVLERAS